MSFSTRMSLISIAIAVAMLTLSLLALVIHDWLCVLFGTRDERARVKEGRKKRRMGTALFLPCAELWPLILAAPYRYSYDFIFLSGHSWIDRVYYKAQTDGPWVHDPQEVFLSIRQKRKLTRKFLALGRANQQIGDIKKVALESTDVRYALYSMQQDIAEYADGIHSSNRTELANQQAITDRMLQELKEQVQKPTALSI